MIFNVQDVFELTNRINVFTVIIVLKSNINIKKL